MPLNRAQEAAGLLVGAYRTNRPVVELPPSCRPRDVEEAYAVQDAVAQLRGPIRGWKSGPATPRRCAPVFAIEQSGVTLEAARFPWLGIEIEFGFCVTADLPPRGKPYEWVEVFEKLEFVPLMELVSSRYVEKECRSPLELLADNLTNGAFIVGAPIAEWDAFDFRNHPASLTINGKTVQSAPGTPHEGSPPDGIVWLANHTAGRTGGLRKGDVITTGALNGTTKAGAGDKAVGDWGDWGKVEVSFR